LPDRTYVFDGVAFAQVVERTVDEWRQHMVNPRHLLFNAFFQILRDALGAAGVKVGAYRLFQIVNALAGTMGLLLFGNAARRLTRDAGLGWCAALLLGATLGYGTRATEGQVYMLMSFGAIVVLWTSARLLERPGLGRAAALILAAAMSALFHIADVFVLPAAALALWLAFPKRRAAAAAGAAGAAALVAVPFLLAFGGLQDFLKQADFHHAAGGGFWSGVGSDLWGSGGFIPFARLVNLWSETGQALTTMPSGAAIAAGLTLWAAAGLAAWNAWPRLDAPRRAMAKIVALTWAGYTVVNLFWLGGVFFYVPPHACALLLLCLWLGTRPMPLEGRRKVLAGLAAAGAALGAWNAYAGLLPQSRLENNPGYSRAMFVGAHTEPASVVIISGFGFANSKVYLPNFAHRSREVLELYFNGAPKDQALRQFSDQIAVYSKSGIPMYLLSDLAEPSHVAAEMKSLWDVDIGEVERAFGDGRMIKTATSPEERIYLFVPKGREAELFAVLGYNVLVENDAARLAETAAALKELAREMSPAERRRAAGLLRAKNWGFDLLWDGFSQGMSLESVNAARARAETFAAYTQTAPFWQRAGNLYLLLNLKPEALGAWSRSEKLSGDAGLRRDIELLRRAP
jgi:hypothetical protein